MPSSVLPRTIPAVDAAGGFDETRTEGGREGVPGGSEIARGGWEGNTATGGRDERIGGSDAARGGCDGAVAGAATGGRDERIGGSDAARGGCDGTVAGAATGGRDDAARGGSGALGESSDPHSLSISSVDGGGSDTGRSDTGFRLEGPLPPSCDGRGGSEGWDLLLSAGSSLIGLSHHAS